MIEQDYLRAKKASPPPWEPDDLHENNEGNRFIHDAILRANIDVKSDYNAGIFHQKFVVRDRASLLTGSTNFTPTGTQNNLNHVVIVHDSKVAKTYAREFAEIQQGHFGKLNEGHDPSPTDVVVSKFRCACCSPPTTTRK